MCTRVYLFDYLTRRDCDETRWVVYCVHEYKSYTVIGKSHFKIRYWTGHDPRPDPITTRPRYDLIVPSRPPPPPLCTRAAAARARDTKLETRQDLRQENENSPHVSLSMPPFAMTCVILRVIALVVVSSRVERCDVLMSETHAQTGHRLRSRGVSNLCSALLWPLREQYFTRAVH